MTDDIEQLIEQLKVAQTPAEMAKLTIKLFQQCGIYNPQMVALEIARLMVTSGHMGG
jgi:hypothetical protein